MTTTTTAPAPVATTALAIAEPVIDGEVFEGDLPTTEPTTEPGPAGTEARISALKAMWAKGTEDELDALFNVGVARVIKCRVAYMAGALGSKNGEPNNKAAMRILDLAQNSVRPYFLGGQALAKAGWDGHVLAPTQAEIDLITPIVSKAQGGTKKRTTDTPRNTKPAEGGTGAEGAEGAEGGSDTRSTKADPAGPVILADVINAMEALQSAVAGFTREQGFTGSVADNLQDVLAEVAGMIDQHRVDGGDTDTDISDL